MNSNAKTQRLTVSAMMLAVATVLSVVCAYMPFLNLPFGGGFTIASMLPIVIVSYMYGIKHGIFTAFCYSVIQIIISLTQGTGGTVMAMFMPSSDSYMGIWKAALIVLMDYIAAYTVIGFGGMFAKSIKNKTAALVLGSIAALSLRYIIHIISGAVFYGAWAEWFFSQDGFFSIGETILNSFSGTSLAVIYSAFYNGLYMVPEIIITAVCASIVSFIPQIKNK